MNRESRLRIARRQFLARGALAMAGGPTFATVFAAESDAVAPAEIPLLVATWRFGLAANEAALKVLLANQNGLDAVEQGIRVIESDRKNSSVGLGGIPNAAGVVQLDACIMSGPDHKAGSVAALEGFPHPISIARRVMEETSHVMLVGEGARMFALDQGFEPAAADSAAQRNRKKTREQRQPNHDTIALLVLGPDGDLAGGCSTSGLGHKLPGRVGDSPIIGSGLYVDNEVGAAGATGIGENVMRYCGSFMIVELMHQGFHPQEACQEVVRRIVRKEKSSRGLNINFVALDKKGRFGAATSEKEFPYSVTTKSSSRVLKCASPGG